MQGCEHMHHVILEFFLLHSHAQQVSLVGSNPASRSGSPTPRFRSEYGAAAGTGDYNSGSSGPLPLLTSASIKQRQQALSARTASSTHLLMPAVARNIEIPAGLADAFGSVSSLNGGGYVRQSSPGQSESGSGPLRVLGGDDGGGVNSPVSKSVLPRSTTPPGPSTPGPSTGFTIRQETVLRLLSAPSDKVIYVINILTFRVGAMFMLQLLQLHVLPVPTAYSHFPEGGRLAV